VGWVRPLRLTYSISLAPRMTRCYVAMWYKSRATKYTACVSTIDRRRDICESSTLWEQNVTSYRPFNELDELSSTLMSFDHQSQPPFPSGSQPPFLWQKEYEQYTVLKQHDFV
jgi:hypothetical protein